MSDKSLNQLVVMLLLCFACFFIVGKWSKKSEKGNFNLYQKEVRKKHIVVHMWEKCSHTQKYHTVSVRNRIPHEHSQLSRAMIYFVIKTAANTLLTMKKCLRASTTILTEKQNHRHFFICLKHFFICSQTQTLTYTVGIFFYQRN